MFCGVAFDVRFCLFENDPNIQFLNAMILQGVGGLGVKMQLQCIEKHSFSNDVMRMLSEPLLRFDF